MAKLIIGRMLPTIPPEEQEWLDLCEMLGWQLQRLYGPDHASVYLPTGELREVWACATMRALIRELIGLVPGNRDVVLRDILR